MSRKPCPEQSPECPYFNEQSGCFADIHHKMFPRADYRQGVAREFRDLPENKELLCRFQHDEIHATEWPPRKPSTQAMLEALGRLTVAE